MIIVSFNSQIYKFDNNKFGIKLMIISNIIIIIIHQNHKILIQKNIKKI